jgi:uncharacterized membrane protein YwzB
MFNLLLYVLILILVIWTMDGVNINRIFKTNKIFQARIFYIMIVFSLTYLVTNFIIDFTNCLN